MSTTRAVPQAYVDGFTKFEELEIHVDERVLVPREESELLVLAALGLPDGARVHEVGTGSGAIALAIKHKRADLRVSASDISSAAIEVATDNAEHLGIGGVLFSVCEGVPFNLKEHWVDLLVANLPYLTDDSLEDRPAEVEAEPRIATTGASGDDGLGEIRKLIEECPPKWRVALEHDTHHGEAVRSMLVDAETMTDQSGAERMTTGMIPFN